MKSKWNSVRNIVVGETGDESNIFCVSINSVVVCVIALKI